MHWPVHKVLIHKGFWQKGQCQCLVSGVIVHMNSVKTHEQFIRSIADLKTPKPPTKTNIILATAFALNKSGKKRPYVLKSARGSQEEEEGKIIVEDMFAFLGVAYIKYLFKSFHSLQLKCSYRSATASCCSLFSTLH